MGDDLIPPDKANPGGYFESIKINRLNEEILNKFVPKRLPGIFGNLFTPARTLYMQRWLSKIDAEVEIASTEEFDSKIKYFTCQTPFCFKDPRFSYTLPVWLKNMTDDTEMIVVFRNPADVISSMVLEAERDSAIRGVKLKFGEKEAFAVWDAMYQHVLKTFDHAKNKDLWTFINYEQLISDHKVIADLEVKLGVGINRSFIDRKLDHGKKDPTKISNENIARTYQILCELSTSAKK